MPESSIKKGIGIMYLPESSTKGKQWWFVTIRKMEQKENGVTEKLLVYKTKQNGFILQENGRMERTTISLQSDGEKRC